MKNTISKLFVTGDSFSQMTPNDINENVWPNLVARTLDADLLNASSVGVSQDWNWAIIDTWADEITPDDQLIILLTDPGRFWFIEDRPDLSNTWIIESEFEKEIGSIELKKAIEYYIQYIQRPDLDTRFLIYRLGWLNNLVKIKNWRKPLIIKAFNQFIPNVDNYPDLLIIPGDLVNISHFETNANNPPDFKFLDVRYNHLTLSNHTILANKISNFLITGEPIDLSSGFNTNVYGEKSINDPEFAKNELSLVSIERYKFLKATMPSEHKSLMSRILPIKQK